jgi:hypothetical protein
LCGTTLPPPDLCFGFGLGFGLGVGFAVLAPAGSLVGDGVARRAWCLALGAGVEDELAEAGGMLTVGWGAEAPGPAWKPVRDAADPWPGETSTKAATMTPAKTSGPSPNTRTLASLPRLYFQAGLEGLENLPVSRGLTPRPVAAGAA